MLATPLPGAQFDMFQVPHAECSSVYLSCHKGVSHSLVKNLSCIHLFWVVQCYCFTPTPALSARIQWKAWTCFLKNEYDQDQHKILAVPWISRWSAFTEYWISTVKDIYSDTAINLWWKLKFRRPHHNPSKKCSKSSKSNTPQSTGESSSDLS